MIQYEKIQSKKSDLKIIRILYERYFFYKNLYNMNYRLLLYKIRKFIHIINSDKDHIAITRIVKYKYFTYFYCM